MPQFDIIDAHVHTYPSREIGLRTKGDVPGDGNTHAGTVEELEAAMAGGGISRSVVLCLHPYYEMREAALKRLPDGLGEVERRKAEAEIEEMLLGRQQRRNQWTCDVSKQRPALVPFLTFDPSMGAGAICREIEDRVQRQGARGIKLHASLNRFYPYDPRLFPAYDLAQELGLPIVYHGGSFIGATGEFSRPKHFTEVARRFPRITFVLAHLGSQRYLEETREIAGLYPQVAFDCCALVSGVGRPGGLSPGEFVAVVREVGVHRVLFGSDYPYFDPARAAAALLALPFTDDEKRLVLAGNARRILRLP